MSRAVSRASPLMAFVDAGSGGESLTIIRATVSFPTANFAITSAVSHRQQRHTAASSPMVARSPGAPQARADLLMLRRTEIASRADAVSALTDPLSLIALLLAARPIATSDRALALIDARRLADRAMSSARAIDICIARERLTPQVAFVESGGIIDLSLSAPGLRPPSHHLRGSTARFGLDAGPARQLAGRAPASRLLRRASASLRRESLLLGHEANVLASNRENASTVRQSRLRHRLSCPSA